MLRRRFEAFTSALTRTDDAENRAPFSSSLSLADESKSRGAVYKRREAL